MDEGRLLDGKVAIVTGAGPGMGRSIALRFAAHGARVIVGARQRNRLEDLVDEIRLIGGDAHAVACDISDPASCQGIVDAAQEHYGRLDVVVQNGHHEGDWSPAASADPDSWRQIMDINFFGALQLVQAAVPAMERAGGGAVVLVNSGAAVRFPANMGAYSSSKAALAALTRTLGLELGPEQIRVNGIFLGPVAGREPLPPRPRRRRCRRAVAGSVDRDEVDRDPARSSADPGRMRGLGALPVLVAVGAGDGSASRGQRRSVAVVTANLLPSGAVLPV